MNGDEKHNDCPMIKEPNDKKIPYSKTYERQSEYAREYYEKHKEDMRAKARERLYKKAGGIRPPGRPRKNSPNGGFIKIYDESATKINQDIA